MRLKTAFSFWSILCKRSLQPSEMYPEKTFKPGSLRLLVNSLRKTTQVACCDNSKKSCSRQPPAFGRSPAKSSASLRRYAPKKRSRQTAFSFWSIPCGKSRQHPEMYPGKMFTPDGLRLLVNPLQKDRPAFGDIPRKNVYTRLPSAFGRYSAKGPSSFQLLVNPLQKASPAPGDVPRPFASGCRL